ncbi:DNA-binding transcriptional regulator, GntR family [Actinomadura madurae]|uniref:DNA-binding transcriptional regulator, GntR family n=1 Tax=Actinomadura madurae TaxID=1993 RepID=A0A1I5E9F1_9ACTN|nr:GntR family transcriptional regulator [Actinomadura madurae]SFO08169.1 DNA-binding transcriptional regulator, GntR family [Actinomadura madurae]
MALPAPLPPPPRRVLGTRLQLSDEAAARIRELIMDGRVRPGDYLRLERLALEFGISVTPVREALKSLRSEGFVVLEPRRGFVVAPLSKRDVQDLFWVQAGIAAELAARAVPRIGPAALRELDGLQLGLEHAMAVHRPDLMEDGNHRFHREINLAAGSPKLAWSLGTAARYVPRGLYGRLAGWPGLAVRDHALILAALRDGDPRAAAREMRAHIVRAGDLLVAHLERRGMWREESTNVKP